MIRLLFCTLCWISFALVAALVGFPALYFTGRVDLLWKLSVWASYMGYHLAGVRIRPVGLEKLDAARAYLFISNHVSNLDPPIITKLLDRRMAVITKQELFKIPLFGRAMRAADFIPIDRKDSKSALKSVHEAARVLQSGIGMLVFPEGTRSPDGKLLPFKNGPFHLAMEAGVPVVPVTIVGSYQAWPKGSLVLRPGEVVVYFHDPIDPRQFARKQDLLTAVRATIEGALPDAYRDSPTDEAAAR